MRYTFDFNLSTRIKLDLEGSSLEECKEKLSKMTLEEIISEGACFGSDSHDYEITDLDQTLVEQTLIVKVSGLSYDVDEDDMVNAEDLPTEVEVKVPMHKDYDDLNDPSEAIINAVECEVGYVVTSYSSWQILEIF